MNRGESDTHPDPEHEDELIESPPGAKNTSGALNRARVLAEGIRGRLKPVEGFTAEVEGDRTEFLADGKTVARLLPTMGFLRVDLDPRAGVGNAEALRRLGSPHPDARLSKMGWRQVEVRTRRDAADVVHALRVPRVKSTGERSVWRERYRPAPGGIVVGGVRVRRAYDEPLPEDGARILVDKHWPKALDRDTANLTDWWPLVAPSDRLRAAYGVAPARLRVFRRAYLSELRGSSRADIVSKLRGVFRRGPLTLLTATRELDISPASVLAQAVSRGRTPRI